MDSSRADGMPPNPRLQRPAAVGGAHTPVPVPRDDIRRHCAPAWLQSHRPAVALGEPTCGRVGILQRPMDDEGLSPERKSWSAAGHVGRLVGGCFGLVFVVGPMHLRLIVETGRKQGFLIMRSPNPA